LQDLIELGPMVKVCGEINDETWSVSGQMSNQSHLQKPAQATTLADCIINV